jgi:hypothetical protein
VILKKSHRNNKQNIKQRKKNNQMPKSRADIKKTIIMTLASASNAPMSAESILLSGRVGVSTMSMMRAVIDEMVTHGTLICCPDNPAYENGLVPPTFRLSHGVAIGDVKLMSTFVRRKLRRYQQSLHERVKTKVNILSVLRNDEHKTDGAQQQTLRDKLFPNDADNDDIKATRTSFLRMCLCDLMTSGKISRLGNGSYVAL